jgi:hypothetical protein
MAMTNVLPCGVPFWTALADNIIGHRDLAEPIDQPSSNGQHINTSTIHRQATKNTSTSQVNPAHHVTQQSAMENSPFQKLPAELRNQIFELVVVLPNHIKLTSSS